MTDPLEAAVGAAAFANRAVDGCHTRSETMDAPPCYLCQEMAEASVKAALPHLRQRHFAEAADALDEYAKTVSSVDLQDGVQMARDFLRSQEGK